MRAVSLVVMALSFASVAAAKDHPCKRVQAACVAAGYYRGGAKVHRGISRDCVQPLLAGYAVPGVSIDPAEVQKCVAVRSAKRGLPPPAPPPPPFPPPKE